MSCDLDHHGPTAAAHVADVYPGGVELAGAEPLQGPPRGGVGGVVHQLGELRVLVQLQHEDLAQGLAGGDALHHHGLRPQLRHPALLRPVRSLPGHQVDQAGLQLGPDIVTGLALDGPVVSL